MNITLIIKQRRNGQPCAKSQTVLADLEMRDLLAQIDHIAIADESDQSSEGYALATLHQVDAAPFFLVDDGHQVRVYRSYYKFLREILNQTVDEALETAEIISQNPVLDYCI
jgi:aminoglycoside phosphotransferase (APT) family kinase protein